MINVNKLTFNQITDKSTGLHAGNRIRMRWRMTFVLSIVI